jgi:transposase-like protein
LVNLNIIKLMDDFPEERCRIVLEHLRWPEGIRCIRCESEKVSRIYDRDQYDCDSCRYRFSVTSGTMMHDTHLSLRKWFVATFLMCESKKGISSLQLQRTLGVAYRTAWYLTHRIRAAMGQNERPMLTGTVEADETWVGGKRKHVGSGYIENKVQVLGAIERGGDIRLAVHGKGTRANTANLHAFLRSVVSDDAPAIYTDENPGYRGIADEDTIHATVNHRDEEWVRGDVHTNTAESAWSLFKRSLVGSYHQLSVKHLDAYLGEFEWRFNNRENPFLFRDTLGSLMRAESMPYKELTADGVA